ncbi:MAG TPA: TolC family protein [Blastocatellia bacterium]|nr:TolC family protein [Blastocatellia bacterium]
MRRPISLAIRIGGPATVFLWAVTILTPNAGAQLGAAAGGSQGTPATQLPLSGRNAQGGSVTSTQAPVPGTTTSVNTLNPSVQVQGPFAGSTRSTDKLPFSGRLSLIEAIERGTEFNLGAVGLTQAVQQSRGQTRAARSALLPNIGANLSGTMQQLNLAASGLRFEAPIPGFSVPSVVGPFNYFDLRASLSHTVMDMTAWNNYRAAGENERATEFSADDARDLVVFAVGGAYLQVIAAKAKVEAARVQLETANALYQQTQQQRSAGLVAQTDLNRSRIQALTQQQRLISLQNDLAKQKINLARLTGLSPNDAYETIDEIPFAPLPPVVLDDALKQAFEQRSDLKAAEAQVRAAERALAAARAERLPSFSMRADYGVIGTNPAQSHGTFALVGTIHIPIWQGNRIKADIEQATAPLIQRRAELEDLRGRIEAEVRNAYLDLQATTSQVGVAMKNIEAARENLDLTRQRFDAGVGDNVEVVQSQESVATAQLDYINSVFAHNVAKLSLARAIGRAAENFRRFLNVQ